MAFPGCTCTGVLTCILIGTVWLTLILMAGWWLWTPKASRQEMRGKNKMKRISFKPLNVPQYEAVIANPEEHRELYEEASAKVIEQFGERHRASRMILNGIDVQNVTGSNFFWNNQLGKYLPKGQRVMTLQDLEGIFSSNKEFFRGFYTDVPEICLRNDEPSWKPNKYLLKNLAEQVREEGSEFFPENPALISDLELVKDGNTRNHYGILLKLGEDSKVVSDSRFASGNNRILLGNTSTNLYTKPNGLSRLCLYRNLGMDSYWYSLANDDPDGRVVLVGGEATQNSEKQ